MVAWVEGGGYDTQRAGEECGDEAHRHQGSLRLCAGVPAASCPQEPGVLVGTFCLCSRAPTLHTVGRQHLAVIPTQGAVGQRWGQGSKLQLQTWTST